MNWWKRGIPASEHSRVAKVLDWTVDHLLTGSAPTSASGQSKENHSLLEASIASDQMTTSVPVMDQEFSAGQGAAAQSIEDFFDGHRDISLSDLDAHGIQPSNARIIKIRGDSMWPTLWGGDEVLADTHVPRLTSSKIYAFEFDGELKVKRFTKKMDGSWLISSDNKDDPAYTDEIVSAHNAQQLRVIAEVKKLVSRNL
ncbi:Phage repressor protein C, contains Cro/C1-type HTH and peptisase s24 domains [Marinobacterium stanieri]|uniref:Phage repressor protein C, contains Cro/C1-type HTH and peptisase s24 domains n=2 Tax=Marinobacterium stanieri TaxID=49186 RepID=A0A1N6QCR8_9GAMM|nr:Phage repressor protein C, contains Cro/C1-type HTH and peptisase s24 domains [Marinobacterium stanieri]